MLIKIEGFIKNLEEKLKTEYNLIFPCDGLGKCKKCKIKVLEGNINPTNLDKEAFTQLELDKGYRLACDKYDVSNCLIDVSFMNNSYGKIYSNTYDEIDYNDEYKMIVDFGSTTVVTQLVNITKSKAVLENKYLNPQIKYGSDIISRVNFSSKNYDALYNDTHNFLIKIIKDYLDLGVAFNSVIISGNNVMNHIIYKEKIESFGLYPFNYIFKDEKKFTIKINNNQLNIYLFPSFSSFVGGDLVSGVYSLLDKNINNYILLDLGTNGEIVLKKGNKYYCTSTAVGPCLEGYNISCGMPYLDGAIYDCSKDIKYLGDNPKGICGSGLVSIIKKLLLEEQIDETGLLEKEKYYLINDIYLARKDVREYQLAKSAIYTGIHILLNKSGLNYNDIDKIYITGGLSQIIDLEAFYVTGLIPKELFNKLEIIKNTSLNGAFKKAIENKTLEEVTDNYEAFNLNDEPDFEMLFVENLMFEI